MKEINETQGLQLFIGLGQIEGPIIKHISAKVTSKFQLLSDCMAFKIHEEYNVEYIVTMKIQCFA